METPKHIPDLSYAAFVHELELLHEGGHHHDGPIPGLPLPNYTNWLIWRRQKVIEAGADAIIYLATSFDPKMQAKLEFAVGALGGILERLAGSVEDLTP